MNPDISVIIPAKDEEDSLSELCQWISRVMLEHGFSYEVIFIDDGSTDSTWQQISLLNRRSALEKIAAFILELDRRDQDRAARRSSIFLRMSRADIADFLGLTIETVSRNLTKLKVQKIIALPDIHKVIIVDRARLSELADGDVD